MGGQGECERDGGHSGGWGVVFGVLEDVREILGRAEANAMGMEEDWGGTEEADVPVGAVCEGQGVGAGRRRPLDEREQKCRGKCDRV